VSPYDEHAKHSGRSRGHRTLARAHLGAAQQRERVYAALESDRDRTMRELAAAAGCSARTAWERVRELQVAGRAVVRAGKGGFLLARRAP
jgi:biotin operon repressor